MKELNTRCLFRYDDGNYCKRWAQRGSRFCYNHQPQGVLDPNSYNEGPGHGAGDWPRLHPHARLATPSDLFDLVRETLNAMRMGTIPPAQAAGVCSLASLWLKLYEKLQADARVYALSSQIIPTLVDAESAAHHERLQQQTAENDHQMQLQAEMEQIVKFGLPEESAAEETPGPAVSGAAPVEADCTSVMNLP